MIRVILADDESHAKERLKDLLDRTESFEIIGEASDGNEALSLMITLEPDVAFLDINMPGISVFQSLPSLKNPPLIVFQTAYSEHAADAFDIDALDYLLKPVRFERLEKAVQKIKEKLGIDQSGQQKTTEGPKRLSVKVQGHTKLLAIADIICISFENGICSIYTQEDRLISDKYVSYYEERLQHDGFFRTSRNDLINLQAIRTIHKCSTGCSVELSNGMNVSLSRRKAQSLRKMVDF